MRNACVILVLLLFSLPAFAATLNVNATSLSPNYANTNSSVRMLNLTLNATNGNVNVTKINLTISNATVGNLSYVELINESLRIIGSSSTFNSTDNLTEISISGGFVVTTSLNRSIVIVFGIHPNATRLALISANISSNLSFATNDSVNNSAYLQGTSLRSSESQIQDVHANASITPRFVDTSVVNQTFVYVITPTGADKINRTVINIPSGYTFVRVNVVTIDSSNTSGAYTLEGNTTGSTQLRINYSAGQTSQPIMVYFTANTNASRINSSEFTSIISGSNLTDVNTTVTSFNTNVTTQQLINVTSVRTTKNAAYLNGTDYWEFNFTMNFTANATGVIQFKMNNWTNAEGTVNITLTNSTGNEFYASLRDQANSSRVINVTYDYSHNLTLSSCCNTATVYNVVLKTIIPSTVTTVSSSWWTTYTMLFRSDPS